MDEPFFDHSTFSKNRERVLGGNEGARIFFAMILSRAEECGLLSDEHFAVDGTQIDSWLSLESFRPKEGEPGIFL